MGCVSSKMGRERRRKNRDKLEISGGADLVNHVVSLTSSTYGALNLDRKDPQEQPASILQRRTFQAFLPTIGKPEIIDARELMGDLDDDDDDIPEKKETLSKITKQKIPPGKENTNKEDPPEKSNPDPRRVLKPLNPETPKSTTSPLKCWSTPPKQTIRSSSFRRRSSSRSPLFDPELVSFFEKEHIFSKCPPGGEEAVVLYTTSLRGIRKTFDDCNDVRAVIESHGVRILERDISMDSGFREELRVLVGKREVRVPVLFVKGRLVGGAEEVMKMEEEGGLKKMLAGIPRAGGWCDGCGGMKFVLCMDCSGSRKVFDEAEKKTVRCGDCNENGLILCPICG